MQSVEVSGRFVTDMRMPVPGEVRFVPSSIWVEEDGKAYPVMAPEAKLVNGEFHVELTRTDQHELPWHYTVYSPIGRWTIKIEEDGPLLLKNLLPKRFA